LEESYEPFQDIQVPTDKVIQVGLNVYQLVGQSFVDLDGNPVDPSRVTKFTIRSIQGDVFEFTDGQPRWIPASRTARRVNGLEESKLLYSVIEVMVDGSNVVNKSQQRFYTHPGDAWEISLLFYTMHVDARDGLFGNKLGKSVNLEFPDGSVKNYPLKNGVAEITSLPRGIYTIEFVGIKGMSNRTPVALSRDQDVHTKVITYLDMVVVGLLGILVALGMLLYGRPGLLRVLRGKKQPVLQPSFAFTNQLALEASSSLQGDGYQIFHYEGTLNLEAGAFKQLTGVGRESFENMLASLHRAWGSRSKNTKLSRADQLLLTLISLKGEQSITQLSEAYDLSETTVRRTIKKVKATLANTDELTPLFKETSVSEQIFIEDGDRIFIEKVVRRELDRLGNEIFRIEWPIIEEKVNSEPNRFGKGVFIEELVMDGPDSQPMGVLVDAMSHPVEAVYEK
jgi:archaellum component FlaF (FlaF/FlaG flagellin family)